MLRFHDRWRVLMSQLFLFLLFACCGKCNQAEVNCTVDLFTIISKPHEYVYIARGDFWLGLHLTTTLTSGSAANSDPHCHEVSSLRIHIFTDTLWIMDHGRELGYHMYNISSQHERFHALHDRFMQIYRPNHHSINTVEYEFLCFFRWHLFREAVEEWNNQRNQSPIKKIITMDSDAMILANANSLYYNMHRSLDFLSADSFELIVVTPGAFHLWSPHGLRTYSDFMYEWYSHPVDKVTANTKLVAGYLYGTLHFSDMQMVEVFASKNSSVRSLRYCRATLYNIWQRRSEDAALLRKLGCIPMARYSDMMSNNSLRMDFNTTATATVRSGGEVLYGQHEEIPFCFMHFQGDGVKGLLKVFAKVVLLQMGQTQLPDYLSNSSHSRIGNNGSVSTTALAETPDPSPLRQRAPMHRSSHSRPHHNHAHSTYPCLQQLLAEPLLLSRRKSREIFIVAADVNSSFRTVQLKRIANFNTFLALNFSLKQVTHNVPSEVMQMLPRGLDVDCNC